MLHGVLQAFAKEILSISPAVLTQMKAFQCQAAASIFYSCTCTGKGSISYIAHGVLTAGKLLEVLSYVVFE